MHLQRRLSEAESIIQALYSGSGSKREEQASMKQRIIEAMNLLFDLQRKAAHSLSVVDQTVEKEKAVFVEIVARQRPWMPK